MLFSFFPWILNFWLIDSHFLCCVLLYQEIKEIKIVVFMNIEHCAGHQFSWTERFSLGSGRGMALSECRERKRRIRDAYPGLEKWTVHACCHQENNCTMRHSYGGWTMKKIAPNQDHIKRYILLNGKTKINTRARVHSY